MLILTCTRSTHSGAKKHNMWAGIFGNHIQVVGPVYLEEHLNSNLYLDMLDPLIIYPRIVDIMEQDEKFN